MKDAFDFTGKVALVTGSSRGIGAGLVTALGQAGARCAINYVADAQGKNKADAERVASALPGSCVIECNVGNAEEVDAIDANSGSTGTRSFASHRCGMRLARKASSSGRPSCSA